MQRLSPRAVVSLAAVVVIAAVVAFLLLFDFKGVFERRASTALAKPVHLAALHLRIFPLRLVLDGLVIDDPARPRGQPLMHADHVDATLAFWRLVKGEVLLPHLEVDGAVVRVERDAKGATNWQSQAAPAPPTRRHLAAEPELPQVEDLDLHSTQLKYRDVSYGTDLTLNLETHDRPGQPDSPDRDLTVIGKGSYQGQPSTITMTGGSLLALRDPSKPYPLDLKFDSGDTHVTLKGTVTDPVHVTGLDVTLAVKGADAGDLYRVAGIALPETPPYTITARLDRDGAKWIFRKLAWKMGDSDLAGDLTWDLSGAKPKLAGSLTANILDLDDLAGFIGAAPGKAKTSEEERRAAADRERALRAANAPAQPESTAPAAKSAPVAQTAAKAPPVADELVIPDRTLDLDKINSMNADVHLAAAHIVNAGFPLDKLAVTLQLQDGVLRLKPLDFGIDQGSIALDVTIHGDKTPVHTDAVVDIRNYPLDRLVGKLAANNTSFGAIGGHVELHGNGDSMHRILASSDGDVGLIMQGGEISDLAVQLMGLNLAKTIGLLLGGDKPVPIRCVAADFTVNSGVMNAKALVIDTQPTIITGDGTIDFGSEEMALKLHPKPKGVGLGSLRVPLHVSGTFAHPSIGPDKGALILRGGAAVALGVLLTPLGSLLGTLEGGGGKDADCAQLFAQTEQDAHTKTK